MTSTHTGGKEGAQEKQREDEEADRANGVVRSSPVMGSKVKGWGERRERWLEEDVVQMGNTALSWDSAGGGGGGEEEVRSWRAWELQPGEGAEHHLIQCNALWKRLGFLMSASQCINKHFHSGFPCH